jgi:hypothetical protein
MLQALCQGDEGGTIFDWDGAHQFVKKDQVETSLENPCKTRKHRDQLDLSR